MENNHKKINFIPSEEPTSNKGGGEGAAFLNEVCVIFPNYFVHPLLIAISLLC